MNKSLPTAPLVVLLAALLLYNFATLDRIPVFPNDDDGGYAAAAWQFWRSGKPGVPGYKDVVDLGRDVWAFGRIAAAFEGVFLHFAGVSIFDAALPSFLAGVTLVALTGALGSALWDAPTGLLSALLLAASGKFFEACRWARPDILLACFFVASLWMVASARAENPYPRLALAGLLMGLSGDVHLNGFLLSPIPLLFWLLYRPQPRGVRLRAATAFVAAGFAGALYWLGIHYWPEPERFRRQAALFGGETHGLRIATAGALGALKAEWKRYTDWFWAARGHRHLLEGLCVLASGVWMLAREGRPGRALVCVWLAIFVIAALFMSNPFGWYLIFIWPLFALWMGRAFLQFIPRRPAQIVLVMLFSAYLLNLALWHWKALQETPLRARLEELRRLVPADAPVLANGAFWFAFWDRDYTDEMYVKFRSLEASLQPSSGPTGWDVEQRKRGWRYLVAGGDFRRFLDPEVPLENLLASEVYLGRAALARATRAFSLERCTIERRFPGDVGGILVLRVRE